MRTVTGPCPSGSSPIARVAIVRRAALALPVDGHLRGVQVDRHRLAPIAVKRAVKALPGSGHRALDALHMTAPEALGVLQRRRCRRRRGDGPQPGARTVGADILDVIKERPADQLT